MTLRNKKWAFPKNTKSLRSYCTDQGCTNRGRQFAWATNFFLRWPLTVLFVSTELALCHRYGA